MAPLRNLQREPAVDGVPEQGLSRDHRDERHNKRAPTTPACASLPTSLPLIGLLTRLLAGTQTGLLDGGEGLAKRKGVAARRGLKEAWSKAATRWTRTG